MKISVEVYRSLSLLSASALTTNGLKRRNGYMMVAIPLYDTNVWLVETWRLSLLHFLHIVYAFLKKGIILEDPFLELAVVYSFSSFKFCIKNAAIGLCRFRTESTASTRLIQKGI
jgi:hypothetical protein